MELKELMKGYDPYREGFRVLDTDYDNFLLVYHCSHHQPEEPDQSDEALTGQLEKARQHLADYTKSKLAGTERFEKFQRNLKEAVKKDNITDEEVKAELEEFIAMDKTHVQHFH